MATTSFLSQFLPLSAFFAFFAVSVVSLTLQSDIQALRNIKEAVDPNSVSPMSFLSTWRFASDPCESTGTRFLGILCAVAQDQGNSSSRVTAINLEGDGLEGFLTPGIGGLTELTVLNLRHNKFRGPIPNGISNLTKLTKLFLSNNFFSGGIPPGFTRLKGLQEIDISGNRLSGSVSMNITALRGLIRLNFSNNELNGRLPDLSGLWQLKTLDLSGNNLYGSLPLLPLRLTTLILSHNLISGHVSSIRRLHRLQTLDLSDNRFSGTVDGHLLALPQLSRINVSANLFTGIEVIKRLDQPSQLQTLSAHHNRMRGRLPVNLINFQGLREIFLGHNLLSGWIPRQYGQKIEDGSWRSLFLEFNYLEGSPPMEFIQGRRKIRGSLAHNCLHCPKNITFCVGGQRARTDCVPRIGGG